MTRSRARISSTSRPFSATSTVWPRRSKTRIAKIRFTGLSSASRTRRFSGAGPAIAGIATSLAQISRPSPVPPYFRVVESSSCSKGAKMACCFAGRTPTPVSATTNSSLGNRVSPDSSRTATRISLAGGSAQCHLNKPGMVRRKKCACARSVERPFRLPRRRPCRRSSGNAGRNTGMAGETPAPRCAADRPTIYSGHRSGLFKWHWAEAPAPQRWDRRFRLSIPYECPPAKALACRSWSSWGVSSSWRVAMDQTKPNGSRTCP